MLLKTHVQTHASHSQKPTEDTNTSQRQVKKRQWNKKRLRQRKNRETFFHIRHVYDAGNAISTQQTWQRQ